jgi:uncharacterized protein YbjT (DUF2867 family)
MARFLVTGATGTIGRLVCAELLSMGHMVRGLTRSRDAAKLPAGVEAAEGDLDHPDSLAAALEGVDSVHLITHTGPAYAPLLPGEALVAQAKHAGVKRVVVLWRGVVGPIEAAVEGSGLDWTQLQPVDFMSNVLFWGGAIKSGQTIEAPHVDLPAAVVDPADVAAVAARVLADGGHHGRVYSITGPEALSTRQRVDRIAAAISRPIGLRELSVEATRAQWRSAGFADEQIANLEAFAVSPAARTVTSAVADVLDRPPTSFDAWVKRNVQAFG